MLRTDILLRKKFEGKRREQRINGMFQEAEILEDSGEFQNRRCERCFEMLGAMHKAKIKESFTGQQQYREK
jgi:hypothetical protein